MQEVLVCTSTKKKGLSEILGSPKTRGEVLAEIEKDEQFFGILKVFRRICKKN